MKRANIDPEKIYEGWRSRGETEGSQMIDRIRSNPGSKDFLKLARTNPDLNDVPDSTLKAIYANYGRIQAYRRSQTDLDSSLAALITLGMEVGGPKGGEAEAGKPNPINIERALNIIKLASIVYKDQTQIIDFSS